MNKITNHLSHKLANTLIQKPEIECLEEPSTFDDKIGTKFLIMCWTFKYYNKMYKLLD